MKALKLNIYTKSTVDYLYIHRITYDLKANKYGVTKEPFSWLSGIVTRKSEILSWISLRKWKYFKKHFGMLIRGLGTIDSWKKTGGQKSHARVPLTNTGGEQRLEFLPPSVEAASVHPLIRYLSLVIECSFINTKFMNTTSYLCFHGNF